MIAQSILQNLIRVFKVIAIIILIFYIVLILFFGFMTKLIKGFFAFLNVKQKLGIYLINTNVLKQAVLTTVNLVNSKTVNKFVKLVKLVITYKMANVSEKKTVKNF